METSIVESKLSDKSIVYSVQFIDGSDKVQINCVDEHAAQNLQEALRINALDAMVVPS